MYQLFEDQRPLGYPLLLFGEGTRIPSSNSDGDGEGTGIYEEHREWVWGCRSPPLPSPLPFLQDSSFKKYFTLITGRKYLKRLLL